MRYVRERGYPAPEIVSVDGADLVLERATGSTMRVDLARRPWRLVHHARPLADLQKQLHRIAAPEWLPAIGPGGAVIHLDLHPENVLLHGRGALVIDWANARAGHWADDVAQTVVILAATDPRAPRCSPYARSLGRPRGLRSCRRAGAPAGGHRASHG